MREGMGLVNDTLNAKVNYCYLDFLDIVQCKPTQINLKVKT